MAATISIAELHYDLASHQVTFSGHAWVMGMILAVVVVIALLARFLPTWRGSSWEVERAEIGAGSGKVTLKPNNSDRQMAYAIWVELSTRKIGLKIDLEHDVISEVYDSWYQFFSVTRELLKTVPVTQARNESTQKIIKISIDVLNDVLRPHLTTWQARFRRWFENEMAKKENIDKEPQEVQAEFKKFDELKTDLLEVNQRLINYRARMRALVYKD